MELASVFGTNTDSASLPRPLFKALAIWAKLQRVTLLILTATWISPCAFGPSSRYWTNQNTKTLIQQRRTQVLLSHLGFLLSKTLHSILQEIRLGGHKTYPFEHGLPSVSYFRKAADPAFAACLVGNTHLRVPSRPSLGW